MDYQEDAVLETDLQTQEQETVVCDTCVAVEPETAVCEDPVTQEQPAAEEIPVSSEAAVQPQVQKKKSGKGRKVFGLIALCLAVALVSSIMTAIISGVILQIQFGVHKQAVDNQLQVMGESVRTEQGLPVNPAAPAEEGLTPSEIYAQNADAVVGITCVGVETNQFGQQSQVIGTGSGFIISADGYVVTNYHVVEGAQEVTVVTRNDQEFPAQIIGYESGVDVALLKVEATALPYVRLGSSDVLVVGEQVCAIGNPLGEFTYTLTVGHLSAKDRMVSTGGNAYNMLQTDVAINSGSSGGPLFNTKGEVVGITTAKISGESNTGVSIDGLSFAVPIDDVLSIIEDLRTYGYITGAYIGVMVRDVDEYGQSYGLPAGAFVEEVSAGLAAEKAGMKAQDIIVNLGGYDVKSVSDLTRALRKFKAEDTTTITVYRSGQRVDLQITFGAKPVE